MGAGMSGDKALTHAIIREWRAEIRARHALICAVAAKWGKAPRSLKATIKAHELAHFHYFARQWTDTEAT